jgi:hypothetical protein
MFVRAIPTQGKCTQITIVTSAFCLIWYLCLSNISKIKVTAYTNYKKVKLTSLRQRHRYFILVGNAFSSEKSASWAPWEKSKWSRGSDIFLNYLWKWTTGREFLSRDGIFHPFLEGKFLLTLCFRVGNFDDLSSPGFYIFR